MEDIQARLEETSQNCLKAYAAWVSQKKDPKAKGELHSSIHELRKVSSRLEIELAISERDSVTSKPLPIPSHRSNSKGEPGSSILDGGDEVQKPAVQLKTIKRRSGSRKPSDRQGGDKT
ncbi:MAG: hypothetical protein L3J25_10000 [Flavobacteriaceae bacterium]|nr:hypothetical protein [Flavobacteriaceae bacterium]